MLCGQSGKCPVQLVMLVSVVSACVALFQSCLALCDLMDCSLPGPLSMGFSRQRYWSELPRPPAGDRPNPGMRPASLYVSCIGRQVLYH